VQKVHNFWSFTLLHGYGGCGIPLDQDKIGPFLFQNRFKPIKGDVRAERAILF